MKQPLFTLLFVTLTQLSSSLNAEEFDFTEKTPRSQEGQQNLDQLQANIIRTFKSKKIQSRYLAARKMVQLNNDEINKNLISSAIESMNCDNPNYQWFIAHYLQKVSGKKHGINHQAWRDWLRKQYKEVKRGVGEGPVLVEKVKIKAKEMLPEVEVTKMGNAVKAEDVPEGNKASDNVNTDIVKKTDQKKTGSADHTVVGDTLPKVIKKNDKVVVTPTSVDVKAPTKKEMPAISPQNEGSAKDKDASKKEGDAKPVEDNEPSNYNG